MKAKDFKLQYPAFFNYCKKNFGEHPVGALLLAIELYEMCRQSPDAIGWEVMKIGGDKVFTSDSFLDAAKEILKT